MTLEQMIITALGPPIFGAIWFYFGYKAGFDEAKKKAKEECE